MSLPDCGACAGHLAAPAFLEPHRRRTVGGAKGSSLPKKRRLTHAIGFGVQCTRLFHVLLKDVNLSPCMITLPELSMMLGMSLGAVVAAIA